MFWPLVDVFLNSLARFQWCKRRLEFKVSHNVILHSSWESGDCVYHKLNHPRRAVEYTCKVLTLWPHKERTRQAYLCIRRSVSVVEHLDRQMDSQTSELAWYLYNCTCTRVVLKHYFKERVLVLVTWVLVLVLEFQVLVVFSNILTIVLTVIECNAKSCPESYVLSKITHRNKAILQWNPFM